MSPLRRAGAAATREALVQAFVAQLGRPGASDFSVTEAASAAGVSLRTAHSHFPDKASRIRAVAAWAEEAFGPPVPDPSTPEGLPDFVRAAYARAGRNLELTRAMFVAGVGNEVRLERLSARRKRFATLLSTLGAPEAETRRAAAVVSLLASSEAGVPLIDLHRLTLEEAAEAAADAVEAIIERLRRPRRAHR